MFTEMNVKSAVEFESFLSFSPSLAVRNKQVTGPHTALPTKRRADC